MAFFVGRSICRASDGLDECCRIPVARRQTPLPALECQMARNQARCLLQEPGRTEMVADGQHGSSAAIPPDNDASCFERHAYCIGSANPMLAAFRVIGPIRVGTASSIG
ncbi:hypothetical protein XCV2001 [Xanthomonas euvesicatoria pv. vesicatoria str. 85-10]|uniref:Uncharacterized protein n=1 Tax=Xanthomonas euvesicatoria pv. vesicatoria (strain 85-10) TaxID=316273 RepID=Q3BU31_XANE5|nr:hypothetical protein XCV2001 [Xanthomonas euvesicatoria pv. vesicatoria str. 85-10]